jgi:hypothetical protein
MKNMILDIYTSMKLKELRGFLRVTDKFIFLFYN